MLSPAKITVQPSGFNSTVVRLKLSELSLCDLDNLSFNSTVVRLKLSFLSTPTLLEHRFNSTVVRLKLKPKTTNKSNGKMAALLDYL